MASTIYDFPEKVLLKFYIRVLEFFSLLKQIKNEEIEQILDVCGDEFEEEEQSIIGSEILGKEEEEDYEEEEST